MTPFYYLLGNPIVSVVVSIAWIWMLVDAVRRKEWGWVAFMVIIPFSAIYYYFSMFRGSVSGMSGFELPGAGSRMRIKELEAQIHHLDKAHHYLELGDIYFRKGKLLKAEVNYRASLDREPKDIDARAHLGQCLLRQKRAPEARLILEQVCVENPKHDYGYSMMAYAEALAALGETDHAIAVWQQVLAEHNYARARAQLGELYLTKSRRDLALAEFREVLHDDRHAPAFQRRRDRVWVRRAKRGLRQAG